jgi:hypothetical protein
MALGGIAVASLVVAAVATANHAPPDAVHSLPGFAGSTAGQFAGHMLVNETRGAHLFYYFLPSERESAKDDPIVVWFQGGGGASPPWGNQSGPFAFGGFAGGGPSTFGLFNELGPYLTPARGNTTSDSNGWTLERNPFSWTKTANMLFLDQPTGVGYSYFTNTTDGFVADQEELARDAARALQLFVGAHEEYRPNPLFLFGESFAGHYVPAVAHHIVHTPGQYGLNLQGIGLGDGCPGNEHDMAQGDLLHALGYADATQVRQFDAMVSRCKDHLWRQDFPSAFKSCDALTEWKQLVSGGIHDQDSRRYAHYRSLADLPNVDSATQDPEGDATAAYLDTDAVRAALNVPARSVTGSTTQNQFNTTRGLWLGFDGQKSQVFRWPDLVSRLKVLLYNGNFDVSAAANTKRHLSVSLAGTYA